MKVWERRLMKDFQVAPVEIEAEAEGEEGEPAPVNENPLDKFRRISRQVASQTVSGKWGQVLQGVAIESNSQIGRCRNRESFKNQQNLLKAMEQARRLIERSPLPQSRTASPIEIMDETSSTLVQLLKNISEEINEISPGNTLNPNKSRKGTATPNAQLQHLNVQLQGLLSKTPSPRGTLSKAPKTPTPKPLAATKTVITPKTPRSPSPTDEKVLCVKANLSEMMSPPPGKYQAISPTPPPQFQAPTVIPQSPPALPKSPPPVIEVTHPGKLQQKEEKQTEEKPASPKLIDFSENSSSVDKKNEATPLPALPGSPVKVAKRKAPVPNEPSNSNVDITVPRPVASKPQSGSGMIPAPPSKEDVKQIIPTLSTTPATPLMLTKISKENLQESAKKEKAPTPVPTIVQPSTIITVDAVTSDSTEQLITSKDPCSDINKAASSPPCLRPGRKIEDVKTIKRQPKTGWL